RLMDVLVTWTPQTRIDPPGSKQPHHYVIGLGVLEATEPLTSTSHLFTNVAPGTYQGHGEVVAADGTELQAPVLFSIDVIQQPNVNVPIIINIGAIVQ